MLLALVKVWNTEGEQRLVRGIVHREALEDDLKVNGKIEETFERVGNIWFMREDSPPTAGERFDIPINPVSTETQRLLAGGPLVGLPGTPPAPIEVLEDLLPWWEEMKEIVGIIERGEFEPVDDDLKDERGMTFREKLK
jgi:hypothetical protein